jgi:hypothetical protein
MAGSQAIPILVTLGLAAVAAPAVGQTTPKTLAVSQPRPAATATPMKNKTPDAIPPLTNSWVCASGMRLEIYPVSFDDPTTVERYVVVYKQDGGVVASERIDARTAKLFPAYGCNDSDMRNRSELLG